METSQAFQIWTKVGGGKNGEKIEYDWVKGNLIIPEQLVNILCEQNGEGDQIRIGIMMMRMLI